MAENRHVDVPVFGVEETRVLFFPAPLAGVPVWGVAESVPTVHWSNGTETYQETHIKPNFTYTAFFMQNSNTKCLTIAMTKLKSLPLACVQ